MLQGCYTASCGRRIEIKRTAREMNGHARSSWAHLTIQENAFLAL
jgi:hypothetical protein